MDFIMNRPWEIVITIILFITESISTFDMRLIQQKRLGDLPPDEPLLPSWTGLLIPVNYGLLICLFFLNWKYTLTLMIILYVLKVLPVLEIIGNMLMAPFKKH